MKIYFNYYKHMQGWKLCPIVSKFWDGKLCYLYFWKCTIAFDFKKNIIKDLMMN